MQRTFRRVIIRAFRDFNLEGGNYCHNLLFFEDYVYASAKSFLKSTLLGKLPRFYVDGLNVI
jgi:hypothetical protein